jgi:lysine 6-dehydrogenase
MKNVIVLGGGMVGSVIATDLAADADLRVTVVDNRPEALDRCAQRAKRLGLPLQVTRDDLADPRRVHALAAGADVVCGAMASGIALAAMGAVIDAKRPYCDISFMPEDFLDMHDRARTASVTVVPDCGVAPGMSHALAAHCASLLDTCTHIDIFVGGLPVERRWPFEYKAAFSPADVIEEYTRPARLVEHGQVVTKPALSEPELIDLPGVGTLEAFNTDGLRSLTRTLRVPHMREKTLRYPGHIELMGALRHIGLFDTRPVQVGDARIVPRELLAKLMFPHWQYQPGEADLTVMRVEARGTKAGAPTAVRCDVLDQYDHETDTTSMARTTAFPCAIVARLLLAGQIHQHGVLPPETLGTHECFTHLMVEHAKRGVIYRFAQFDTTAGTV